jgi:hypothetical protein
MSASTESRPPEGEKARSMRKIQKIVSVWCMSAYEYRWATKIQFPNAKMKTDRRVKSPSKAVIPAMTVTQESRVKTVGVKNTASGTIAEITRIRSCGSMNSGFFSKTLKWYANESCRGESQNNWAATTTIRLTERLRVVVSGNQYAFH